MKLLYLKFKLKHSASLFLVFLCIYIGTIFCIYFIELSFLLKVIYIISSQIYFIMIIKVYVLRSCPKAIVEVWQDEVGSWYLKKNSGDIMQATLDFPIFISNNLIVLNFICVGKISKIALPIAKDSLLVKDDFRKLKVLIKTINAAGRAWQLKQSR